MPGKTRKRELDSIGLNWVPSDAPGYTRKKSGAGFAFYDLEGRSIKSAPVVKRLQSLAIPPAWTEVWICPDESGYIQATGRDDRGRKQSIYHPLWQAHREEKKYAKMARLDRAIRKVREAVEKHLRLPGLPKNKVIAAAIKLIDETWIRVGNERYATENKSFGVTTLRNRHLKIQNARAILDFPGKGGKKHRLELESRSLARLLLKCKEATTGQLLQFQDKFGNTGPIKSSDVNDYLREFSGIKMTAKDFRTYHATRFAKELIEERAPETKKEIKEIVAEVAEKLGNTPTICRKSYIDSRVLEP